MRRIEDFMNWLTDMDWTWWSLLSLRPTKTDDMDNRLLLQVSSLYGSVIALVEYLSLVILGRLAFTVLGLIARVLIASVMFFLLYKITFAYVWNHRARRLRSDQIENARAL